MNAKVYRVYLLKNPDGRFYIGVSENVSLRLDQHNAGQSKWTAKYRPWTLVWESSGLSLGEARKLENHLKRQKGGNGLRQFLANHPSGRGGIVGSNPAPAPNLKSDGQPRRTF
ncbi:MAG TPA: GIY-YIG nuclease family protein [Lacunisphaera sp.]|nr:GIY-YIG nuclease family protein [Lacunisphaera sp.]